MEPGKPPPGSDSQFSWGEKLIVAGPIAFAITFYIALAAGCLALAAWFLRLAGIIQ